MDAARFSLIMAAFFAALLLIFALSGCAGKEKPHAEIVKVSIPVAVAVQPPAELMQPFRPREMPTFVSPAAPDAAVALTKDEARKLRLTLFDLNARLQAWQAWAVKPQGQNQ